MFNDAFKIISDRRVEKHHEKKTVRNVKNDGKTR